MNNLYKGVCPVMLTPYTGDNKIDYPALEKLTKWYIDSGADSLFAVCQSNEMFSLSGEERTEYAAFVKKHSTVPVFAVGNVETDRIKAISEINRLIEAGIDGIVLITNTIVPQEASSEDWKSGIKWYTENIQQNVPLGLYECPIPYKHLITEDEIRFIVSTGRFAFLKDTCCDTATIKKRLEIIGKAPLSLFNANSTTLLDTLKLGSAGFCGIMANFNTKLCSWLCKHWKEEPVKAEVIQSVLSVASKFGDCTYPINAKLYLSEQGILNTAVTRNKSAVQPSALDREDLKQLRILFKKAEEYVG